MALICFGSIQVSNAILLRHKTVTILEIGTLDYILGKVSESNLPGHIKTLSDEFKLLSGTATVTRELIDDVNYLRVALSVPTDGNITSPGYVGSPIDISSEVLIYRP